MKGDDGVPISVKLLVQVGDLVPSCIREGTVDGRRAKEGLVDLLLDAAIEVRRELKREGGQE